MIRNIYRRLERLEARVLAADYSVSIMIHFVDPEKGVTGTLLLQSGKKVRTKLEK